MPDNILETTLYTGAFKTVQGTKGTDLLILFKTGGLKTEGVETYLIF